MAEKTCPTCGDQNVHANIPSEIIACATRKALVNALHAYAEMIDERSYPMQPFVDLFASMARRLDDDLFVTVLNVTDISKPKGKKGSAWAEREESTWIDKL